MRRWDGKTNASHRMLGGWQARLQGTLRIVDPGSAPACRRLTF